MPLNPFRRHRPPSDEEIAREVRTHLELEAESNGVRADDAAAIARQRFGNVTGTTEDIRAVWHARWLDHLRQDVRVGLRAVRHSPAYAAATVITLALGIGGATAVFSLGNHVLRHPFPFLRNPATTCGSCSRRAIARVAPRPRPQHTPRFAARGRCAPWQPRPHGVARSAAQRGVRW